MSHITYVSLDDRTLNGGNEKKRESMYCTCFGVNGKTGVPDSKVICDNWLEKDVFFFSLLS